MFGGSQGRYLLFDLLELVFELINCGPVFFEESCSAPSQCETDDSGENGKRECY